MQPDSATARYIPCLLTGTSRGSWLVLSTQAASLSCDSEQSSSESFERGEGCYGSEREQHRSLTGGRPPKCPSDEIQLIWKTPHWTLPKFLFLLNRYIVPITLVINSYQFSGLSQPTLTDSFCKVWFAIALFIGVISIAISNFLILLRLWVLWERNLNLMRWTFFLFVVAQLATLGCTAYTVSAMMPKLMFQAALHMCSFTTKPNVLTVWIPGIAFEVMVFVMTCWNAADRPTESNAALTRALYRDGLVYFVVLTSLRVVNLVLAIVAPLSLVFLALFFVWSTTTITLSRLILSLRSISAAEESTRTLIETRTEGDDYELKMMDTLPYSPEPL